MIYLHKDYLLYLIKMYNKKLYNTIINGNIEESLHDVCIILINNNNISEFEETLIALCGYIGSFINIYNIVKFNDIIHHTKLFIENDNINITIILSLISKFCILCDINNKYPTLKAGIIPISKLREKIIDIFDDNSSLSTNGIHKFSTIIPPPNSDSYLLSLKIISNFLKLIKNIDNINNDDGDKLIFISDKLRNSFDYIIRKKFFFETKLIDDPDSVWFLWGFISIIYNNDENISNLYWLFNYNYKKSNKKYRYGLIWSSAINIIYSKKKNLSKLWNKDELIIIYKIEEIALQLYNEVSKNNNSTIVSNNNNNKSSSIDALEYLYKYTPKISLNNDNNHNNTYIEENKIIIS